MTYPSEKGNVIYCDLLYHTCMQEKTFVIPGDEASPTLSVIETVDGIVERMVVHGGRTVEVSLT